MTPTQGPIDRNPTDADDGADDGVPDWDLSVAPLDAHDPTTDGAPGVAQASSLCPDAAPSSADDQSEVTAVEPQSIAADQALDEDDSPDADGESDVCYQGHFLEDDEPETDFVAHVDAVQHDIAATPGTEPPGRAQVAPRTPDALPVVAAPAPEVVKLAARDALTAALVGRTHESETSPAQSAIPETVQRFENDWEDIDVADLVPGVPVTPARQETKSVGASEAVDEVDDPGSVLKPCPGAMPTRGPFFSPTSLSGVGIAPGDEDDLSDAQPVDEIASDIACADADQDIDEPTVPYAATFAEPIPADTWEDSTDPDSDEFEESLPAATGGGWTIPLLCLGIAIIAFCMVIPQADANRRLAYERSSLRADLESVQQQVATNDEFLRKLASDPTLAERLAQRQLNLQRAGTKALAIGMKDTGTSPFDLVKVAPPPSVEPYEPVGGKLAAVCRDGKSRLYLMGVGLFVLAAGLMLGVSGPRR